MKKFFLLLSFALLISTLKSTAQTNQTSSTKTQFSIADSASFTGKYKIEGVDFEYITVSVKEGKLFFEGGEYNGFLDPVADKKDIFDVGGEAVFTFVRNADNKINDLKIDYQGRTFQCKKEEKKG